MAVLNTVAVLNTMADVLAVAAMPSARAVLAVLNTVAVMAAMIAEIAKIALPLSQRFLLSIQARCLSTTVNYERKLFIKSFWLIRRVKKSWQVPIRNSKNKVGIK